MKGGEINMPRYYVNRNAQHPSGDHEVHTTGCPHPPAEENRVSLGNHDNCRTAVTQARNHYAQVNGCYWCANACHTG